MPKKGAMPLKPSSPAVDRADPPDGIVPSATPGTAPPANRFSPPLAGDAPALAVELTDALARYSAQTELDPFANPVLLLALDVSRRLHARKLDPGTLEQLIQYLSAEGFLARADRLGRYLGEADPDANEARLETLIEGLATADGRPVPFPDFQARVEREAFGIVITAHPTFNLSGEQMEILSCLATGREKEGAPLTTHRREEMVRRMAALPHQPEEMTLAREHSLSLVAIANIQSALRTLYMVILRVAQRHYPDRWQDLTPRLITVASWVGYDLDGRSDIRWTDTLHKRLIVQQNQLRHYLMAVKAVQGRLNGAEDLRHTLELLESRVALALTQVTDEIAAFGGHEAATNAAHVQRIARRMAEGLPLRLVDAGHAVELVDRAIRLTQAAGDPGADATVRELAVLRAELSNYGLGMAHTHVRINATQLHNAIRKKVGLETEPDDPRYRQSYLAALTDLLDRVEPVSINFGSIMAERTSAKRLFMVVAQMLKYSDRTTPIRFLVAESEAAFTLLTALYYARLFGIDDRVDISPLFETEKALEVGSRVIEQLLDNPHYRAYVRGRGRLCIQTGYSDAGRYLGQTPASASIERLRLRILRLFTRYGDDLKGVQLLIFDTHGESIGRGGHPGGLEQRLAYVSPPATLHFAAANGIDFKQEVSFQGGDGYTMFITRASALAVVTRILDYLIGTPKPSLDEDPFYAEGDYVREFFTTVKAFQVGLVEDPNYGALLAAFGTNLLYPSGSRAIKRQHEAPDEGPEETMAAQFRAIPHNAILLQMGLPANVLSGVGEAIDRDPERFAELYAGSPRFRTLMGMVEYGMGVACPDALRAYVESLDPALWLRWAAHTADPEERKEMRRVATYLEGTTTHARLVQVFRRLFRDFDTLSTAIAAADRRGSAVQVPPAMPAALGVLHALRLALMHEVFRRATRIPPFSSQHTVTHRRLIARLLHLDVPWALEQLARIFPATSTEPAEGDYGEPSTYVSDESQNYSLENEKIFRPIAGLYDLIRRTGNAITQRIGFFG